MSFYEDRILPHLIGLACGSKPTRKQREKIVHRAYGDEIDRWLGLPEHSPSCALLPIGWPVGRYGRPPRRSVDSCLHWDRFDDQSM